MVEMFVAFFVFCQRGIYYFSIILIMKTLAFWFTDAVNSFSGRLGNREAADEAADSKFHRLATVSLVFMLKNNPLYMELVSA